MAEYFFEVLLEEIPASMHLGATDKLRERLAETLVLLGGLQSAFDHVVVHSTPRRLVGFLHEIPAREIDREEELKGPPVKAAYDAEGEPTQALNGFLKKNNATIGDVIAGGDYIRVRRTIKGRSAAEILQERVPHIIESLRWPKMMRWGMGEHSYIRPIHCVVSMFDGEHLPVTIFGVASGTTTRGHRTLAPETINAVSYNDYLTKLEIAHVVVDEERRRTVMAGRALVLSKEVQGLPSDDPSIWSQWKYLTEYPGVVRAEFSSEYLLLPDEVLVTVMRVHQKQLPIRDANGQLKNSFLAILDNVGDPDGNATYGNSFVTNARFADAKFFYETDRKRTLESRLDYLANLQFQDKLGNYLDKTNRLLRIVQEVSDDPDTLTAARLCKTDLVTDMVKEFTDLQGKIGGIYAREEGLPEKTWQAIYDHYLPVNMDDSLPRTLGGRIISVADKIDTVVAFFGIGLKPTGSKDPFALRRAAQGIVQVLLNRNKPQVSLDFVELLQFVVREHKVSHSVHEELVEFFAERVLTILETSAYGFAYDEIRAAMESGWRSLPDLVDRISALKAVRRDANFLSILDSAKRIANITIGHIDEPINTSRFEHDSERRLYELATNNQIAQMIVEREYQHALESFAAMAPALEKFFEDVMVNVDDARVRRNRMSLLRKVGESVRKIADVTKIVVDRSEYRP